MKVPENARELIAELATSHEAMTYGTCHAPLWLLDLALRALDYEAASGEVTEEMVVLAKARLHEGNAHSRLSVADVRSALLAVAPFLSAAARRKALEEAAAEAEAFGKDSVIVRSIARCIRSLGRPA
jgi:hypothetical protein